MVVIYQMEELLPDVVQDCSPNLYIIFEFLRNPLDLNHPRDAKQVIMEYLNHLEIVL